MNTKKEETIISELRNAATAITIVFLLLTASFLEMAYFPGENRRIPSIAYAIGFVAFWGLLFETKNRADEYIFELFRNDNGDNLKPTPPKVVGWVSITAGILLWLFAGIVVAYPAIYYRSGLEVANSIGFLIISIGLANLAYHRAKPFLPHS